MYIVHLLLQKRQYEPSALRDKIIEAGNIIIENNPVPSRGMAQGSQREPASLGTEGEQRAKATRRFRVSAL